jgi:hypothetical protein
MANATGLTAYDASYLCLAGLLGAELATADTRLAATLGSVVEHAGSWCVTVANPRSTDPDEPRPALSRRDRRRALRCAALYGTVRTRIDCAVFFAVLSD